MATSSEPEREGRARRGIVERLSTDILRTIGLFGGLSGEILDFFASEATPIQLPMGAEVFREDEPGSTIFIVLQGRLELTRRSCQGVEVRLAEVTTMDWFGEVGLIDMKPRSTTVRALENCTLLPIPSSMLNTIYRRDLKAYSLLILNIAREMCRRIRVVDAQLVECKGRGLLPNHEEGTQDTRTTFSSD